MTIVLDPASFGATCTDLLDPPTPLSGLFDVVARGLREGDPARLDDLGGCA